MRKLSACNEFSREIHVPFKLVIIAPPGFLRRSVSNEHTVDIQSRIAVPVRVRHVHPLRQGQAASARHIAARKVATLVPRIVKMTRPHLLDRVRIEGRMQRYTIEPR